MRFPVYLDFAIANDSLRSVFDLGALVPLFRVTAFGRGYLDFELCFRLFCVAGWISLWVDRPDRERRSVAELAAQAGTLLGAAAVLVFPGAIGHAGRRRRGGCRCQSIGSSDRRLACGRRADRAARALVRHAGAPARRRAERDRALLQRRADLGAGAATASGTGATIIHMPSAKRAVADGYGVAIRVKIGLAGGRDRAPGAGNLLRGRPRLIAAREAPRVGSAEPGLLRKLIGTEAVVVAGAVFTAAVLSSLAPPPPAFALQSSAIAQVGPGRVLRTVSRAGYELQVLVSPNKAAAPDSFALRITRGGLPVRGASVTLTFNHLEMQMPQQQYQLSETRPGLYSRAAPALIRANGLLPRSGLPSSSGLAATD